MKFIKDFKAYQINEEAGYGNDYFVDQKHEKSQYYYFKAGEGDEETGIIIKIGKFSKDSIISDTERSYGVIRIEKISHDDMDDYLVNDSEYKSDSEATFSLSTHVLSEVFDILTRAMTNYLEKNPKVTKFYDEILENLDMSPEDYKTFVTPLIDGWSDDVWKIQDGPNSKCLIYTKTSNG